MADSVSTSSSPRIPPLAELSLSSPNRSPESSAFQSPLDLDVHHSHGSDPSAPDFEFGEQVYYRRRQAWLAMGGPVESAPLADEGTDASSTGGSMSRLEALLDGPSGSDVGEQAWRSGLEGVHRGLLGGRRLVKRMKLGLVIKVLRAGWIRDGTWPASLPPVPPSPPYEVSGLPAIGLEQHRSSSGTSQQSPPPSITLPLPPAALAMPKPTDLISPGSATSETTATATTPGTATADTTPDGEGPPSVPEQAAYPLAPPPKIRADEGSDGTPTDQAGPNM